MDLKETGSLHLRLMKEKDLDGFLDTVDLDAVMIIMPNGKVVKGRQAAYDLHKDWFGDGNWSIEYEIRALEQTSEMGFLVADIVYDDVDERGDKVSMKYYLSLIFKYRDGRWLLVFDQNTIHK